MGRLGQVAAIVGTAVLIGVTSTGCASRTTSDEAPSAAIRAAAGQMYSAETVHIHGSVGGASGSTVVDGSWRFAPSPAADIRITTPTKGGKLTLGYGASDGSAQGEVVVDGSVAYVRFPADFIAAAARMPRPGPIWLSSPLDNPGGLLGQVNPDPRKLVEKLLTVGDFTEVGSTRVDGVATTHYTAGFAPGAPAPSPSSSGRGDSVGGATGTADVWLDGKGLPVEVKLGGQGVGVDLHFTDWGAPVQITVPPASQVIPFSPSSLAIPFAISGDAFKVSADQLNGLAFTQAGSMAATTVEVGGNPSCLMIFNPATGTAASASSSFSLKGLSLSISGTCGG